MATKIRCPECGARLDADFVRCPSCHAYVLDASPWRSDGNLVAIPVALGLWFLLDRILQANLIGRLVDALSSAEQAGFSTVDIFGDRISRSILALGIYAFVVLVIKLRTTARQARAFRIVRDVCRAHEDNLSDAVLEEARRRLDEAGLSGCNRYLAYHRLQWLVSAAKTRADRRSGLLDALRQHAEADQDALESAFASAQFMIWAMPSAGFLGTVWGMTRALQSFSGVVGSASDLNFTTGLTSTAQNLGIAFHTTLVGLACVIPVYALATLCRKRAQTVLETLDKYFVRVSATVLLHAEPPEAPPPAGRPAIRRLTPGPASRRS